MANINLIDKNDHDESELERAKSALKEAQRKKQMAQEERQRWENEERRMKLLEKRLKKMIAAAERGGEESIESQSDSRFVVSARFQSEFMYATTNSTASNLVGAGRGIGQLYSKGGRILERAMSEIAHKLGFGPYAVSQRIMGLFPADIYEYSNVNLPESKTKAIMNGIDRLWSYIDHGTPMTQVTAINRFALVAIWARLISKIRDDVMRHSKSLIETCSDLQVISHATLSILVENDFVDRIRTVLKRLYSINLVLERWYEVVTDIFHDNLVVVFSRWLYKSVHHMLVKLNQISLDMHLLRFIDDAFLGQASLPLPEIIRESLQRTIVLAQQDISSNTASVHRARDEDPLSYVAFLDDGWTHRDAKLRCRSRNISGCLELDGCEIQVLDQSEITVDTPRVTKQHRYEELFFPHTPVSDTAHSPFPAISIPAEHRHDLEVWRREIREIGRREGIYFGRTGTFVMKEWEVAVLLDRVLYEGEPEEREFEMKPEREYYGLQHTTFGRLDPWSMGFVAMKPLQEARTSTKDRKLHRSGPKFLSAIRRR